MALCTWNSSDPHLNIKSEVSSPSCNFEVGAGFDGTGFVDDDKMDMVLRDDEIAGMEFDGVILGSGIFQWRWCRKLWVKGFVCSNVM